MYFLAGVSAALTANFRQEYDLRNSEHMKTLLLAFYDERCISDFLSNADV
jgi:hypothetical protein